MRRKPLPAGWRLYQSSSDHDFTATAAFGSGFGSATCSACWIDDPKIWWVSRVLVKPNWRRLGLGTIVLGAVVDRIREAGGTCVQVAPGGYDTPPEVQRAFYRSCGFLDTDAGMMELRL